MIVSFIDSYIISFYTIGLHMIFFMLELGKISPKTTLKIYQDKIDDYIVYRFIYYIILYH